MDEKDFEKKIKANNELIKGILDEGMSLSTFSWRESSEGDYLIFDDLNSMLKRKRGQDAGKSLKIVIAKSDDVYLCAFDYMGKSVWRSEVGLPALKIGQAGDDIDELKSKAVESVMVAIEAIMKPMITDMRIDLLRSKQNLLAKKIGLQT